jgi:hypothetical protein
MSFAVIHSWALLHPFVIYGQSIKFILYIFLYCYPKKMTAYKVLYYMAHSVSTVCPFTFIRFMNRKWQPEFFVSVANTR